MGDVSEESLLDYFYSAGGNSGRVRNADILKTFKPFIGHSEPQRRAKYREEFKLIIDRIAVVKSENGEKYLILKKKYRHLMQERETKHHGPDGEPERRQSPATAEWDTQTASPCKKEEQEEPMSCGEHEEEEQQAGTDNVQNSQHPPSAAHTSEPSALSNGEDELDRDSTSKSESEHDEESTGSMGSTSVALDPTEKEWIYHAASARVPDLSQLLRLEPSLVNKKDFTSGSSPPFFPSCFPCDACFHSCCDGLPPTNSLLLCIGPPNMATKTWQRWWPTPEATSTINHMGDTHLCTLQPCMVIDTLLIYSLELMGQKKTCGTTAAVFPSII
ncbi:ankyrin repeat domain-containing protein SOWAHC isoform X3 [Cyprinodon tularosa]|uniref:ankyrin repeat domain-containing protein SOWAHC isoform X3 n=1 Tax=Cyprinodon tularosa TaxID=77115 RepID=UPI0018E237CC|nr:ankyrin repeat domain-containing protein SOWAHC isoform X3 [Cyprinodon tularosa]